MTIVEQVENPSSRSASYRDSITLTWEERRQGHGRRRSAGGVEFGISLPGGTVLKEGDCLRLHEEDLVVVVHEAAEPVYVFRPGTPQEWAYYAYQAGNRHQPVMIGEAELVFPQNPAVKSLLDQHHVHYETAVRPFNAALATTGHSH